MHVLLLENHPLFATALKQVLLCLEKHVVVRIVAHSAEALDLVETGKAFDLILVAHNPPDENSLLFVRSLHKWRATVPIIIVSSSNEIQHAQFFLEKGVMGFVHKASDAKTMLGAIHQVLSGQRYPLINPAEKEVSSRKVNIHLTELGITDRQFKVLQLLAEGHSNKVMARALDITESTIKSHVSHLMNTLSADNRTSCVLEAQRLGLL